MASWVSVSTELCEDPYKKSLMVLIYVRSLISTCTPTVKAIDFKFFTSQLFVPSQFNQHDITLKSTNSLPLN